MTDGDSGSGSICRFGAFTLDTGRALLTRDGAQVTLRPKTFALLTYMTRHPERVLSKEDLLAAVWPGVVVNDESLSQCVRELRAALGDEHRALIRTVPRRGYLFDARVADAVPGKGPKLPKPDGRRWLAGLALAGVALIVGAAILVQRPHAPAEPSIDTRRSIAVLPFLDRGSASPFGDSVAEDLTDALGRRPGVLVVSFVSSAAIAAREADIGRVGRALGVRHLVSGSVQRDGAAVDVNAQLVSTNTAAVLWSGQFRYAGLADWAWQRDIGAAVAHALNLPPAEGTVPSFTNERQLTALVAIIDGRHDLRHATNLADLRRARAHFESALSVEPDAARAWTGLAWTHLYEVAHGWSKDRNAQLAQAERAAARALELAPEYPRALGVNTESLRARGDLDAALAGYQLWVVYDSSAAWGHARIAELKLRLGRPPEEVLVHADMAQRLSPIEPTLVGHSHLWAGIAEFYLGREDAAYERMRQSASAGPNPTRTGALLWQASLAALQGRQAQAAQHVTSVMELDPGFTISNWRPATALTHPRLVTGRERFAEGMKQAGLPE